MKFSYINDTTLLLICLGFLSCNTSRQEELPIYNPSDFNPDLVDTQLQQKDKNHTVGDFELINQNGKTITQQDYKNKIYVVDFIFTRCLSICPIMTGNMAELQKRYLSNKDISFLSISVTPDIDSIPVLKKYAIENGVVDSKWNITTGNKQHIYELARKSYFAVVVQGDGDLQDFIHTPNFILIDKEKRIRGVYDGTNSEEIKKLVSDIDILTNSELRP